MTGGVTGGGAWIGGVLTGGGTATGGDCTTLSGRAAGGWATGGRIAVVSVVRGAGVWVRRTGTCAAAGRGVAPAGAGGVAVVAGVAPGAVGCTDAAACAAAAACSRRTRESPARAIARAAESARGTVQTRCVPVEAPFC